VSVGLPWQGPSWVSNQ